MITIKKVNIKINRKILLYNGKTLIFVRTRYHKVESENENDLCLLHIKHIHLQIT